MFIMLGLISLVQLFFVRVKFPEIGMELTEDNFTDIKSLIDECISSPKFAAGRDKARKDTWMYMGHGTERTVDYVEKIYNELCEGKL